MKSSCFISLLGILSTLCAFSSFADSSKRVNQTCTPLTQKAPFSKLVMTYQAALREGGAYKLLSDQMQVRATYSKAAGSASDNPTFTDRSVKLVMEECGTWSFQFWDGGDWMSASAVLSRDDNGTNAFVIFSSDGPKLNAYYQCTDLDLEQ